VRRETAARADNQVSLNQLRSGSQSWGRNQWAAKRWQRGFDPNTRSTQ